MSNISSKVRETALTAVLAAIILLMAFTPLGYLHLGPVSITLLVIPVVIGGMTLGPVRGGFLGAVFGATSLAQCFMGDPFVPCGAAFWARCSELPVWHSASWAKPSARPCFP